MKYNLIAAPKTNFVGTYNSCPVEMIKILESTVCFHEKIGKTCIISWRKYMFWEHIGIATSLRKHAYSNTCILKNFTTKIGKFSDKKI